MPPLPAPDETPSAIRTQLPLPPGPILEIPSATPQSEAADHGNAAAAGAPGGAKRTLQHEARSNYAGTVHRHISRYKGFPSELSRKGIEGTVMTRLTLAPGGRLGTVEILRSSGSDLLDRLAVRQIRLAAPFPRPPMALRAMRLSFLVPMVYSAHD
nr:energy transducer TonB [Novosphingobium profundi]